MITRSNIKPAIVQRALIATLWDGSASYACAIGPWCERAAPLASVLSELFREVVVGSVLTQERTRAARRTLRRDCPAARVLRPSRELRRAAARFAREGGGCRHQGAQPPGRSTYQFGGAGFHHLLLRWHLFSLTEFALIVFADLDVELVRPEEGAPGVAAVRARWRSALAEALPPARLGEPRRPRFLSVADHASPLNSGVFTLGWPSRELFARGVRVLSRARWNNRTGFVLPDEAEAAAGGTAAGDAAAPATPRQLFARRPELRRRLRGTAMLREDSWGFIGGNCDQGFLFYTLYVLRDSAASAVGADHLVASGSRVGSLRHARRLPAGVHTARHWLSHPKPWMWSGCHAWLHLNHGAQSAEEQDQCAGLARAAHVDGGGVVATAREPVGGWLDATRLRHTAFWLRHTAAWQTASPENRSECAARFALVAPRLPALSDGGRTAPRWSGKLHLVL